MWLRGYCRVADARSIGRARRSATRAIFFLARHRQHPEILRSPRGEGTRRETGELARRFGLTVADKHDSQDICFVPSGHYAEMIERLKPGAAEAGDIVDLYGNVLGEHS